MMFHYLLKRQSYFKFLILALCLFCGGSFFSMNKDSVKVLMHTSKGKLTLFLYPETPLHQQNFIRLVESKFYEGVLFHRVIKDFMAQAGDPNSKDSLYNGSLGSDSEGDTISAEFVARYHHKKGALSAARTGDNMNPTKASSGSQFYIVQGRKFSTAQLKNMEARKNSQRVGEQLNKFLLKPENINYLNQLKDFQKQNKKDSINFLIERLKPLAITYSEPFKFTEQAILDYSTIGGTPHLDGGYSVFGEVIEGLEIIDQICNTATSNGDKPIEEIKIISIKLIK